MQYTMLTALLLHLGSDNHLLATTVGTPDILLPNVVLNRGTKNDLETGAEIVITIVEIIIDPGAETKIILDPMIGADHETGIDREAVTTTLATETIFENEIVTIPMSIITGSLIAHLLHITEMSIISTSPPSPPPHKLTEMGNPFRQPLYPKCSFCSPQPRSSNHGYYS